MILLGKCGRENTILNIKLSRTAGAHKFYIFRAGNENLLARFCRIWILAQQKLSFGLLQILGLH